MYRHHVDKIIQWLVHRSTQFVTNQLFTWHSIWSYTSIRDYCSKQEGDILLANSDIEFPMSSSDSVNEGVVMCIPRFLSRVPKTWLSGGSTSRCCIRMRRCRWMRTTLGHLTNRCRSFLGGKALPIPNCFSLFSKSRSVTFSSTSQTQPNQCQIKPWHLTCLKEERRNVMGRSTYFFLLGWHRRLATSLRGLQIWFKILAHCINHTHISARYHPETSCPQDPQNQIETS